VNGIWPFIPAAPIFIYLLVANLIAVRINKHREHARAVVDDLIADRERALLVYRSSCSARSPQSRFIPCPECGASVELPRRSDRVIDEEIAVWQAFMSLPPRQGAACLLPDHHGVYA
jgi:hypothetical protein